MSNTAEGEVDLDLTRVVVLVSSIVVSVSVDEATWTFSGGDMSFEPEQMDRWSSHESWYSWSIGNGVGIREFKREFVVDGRDCGRVRVAIGNGKLLSARLTVIRCFIAYFEWRQNAEWRCAWKDGVRSYGTVRTTSFSRPYRRSSAWLCSVAHIF